ncbi:sugar phosphate isomerase/epimerase [Chloroflexi bacterium TSY]|nr:sugar phosphate isomerase/epimerase [Chloroflexi bacterium TSY]
MKISCFSNLANGKTLTDKATFLADAGYDAFELVTTPDELAASLPEIKAIIASGRIAVSAICALHRGWLIDPNPDARQAARHDISRLLELAGEIGNCGVFVIPILGYTHAYPGAPSTGRSRDDDRSLLTEQLAMLAQRAEQLKTMLWLEVINRYESPIANTLAEGATIIENVGSPACKLNADFFHMNIEEADLPAALRQVGSLVGHVHAADSTRTYPGFGHLDYSALIRALTACDYHGYLTVDVGDAELDAGRVLPHVATYLRGLVGLAREQVQSGG